MAIAHTPAQSDAPQAAGFAPISAGVAAAMILAYFLLAWLFHLGRPLPDDVRLTTEIELARYAHSFQEFWRPMWSLHNEHRPVLARLVLLAETLVGGRPDYRFAALIGNLLLLPIFACLVAEARRARAPGAALVLLAALIFNFMSAESSLWAMAALSNFAAPMLAVLMLWLLSRGGALAWLAVLPALAAVGSQANGLIAPFVGAGYLLFNRKFIAGAFWLLASIALAAAYFSFWDMPTPKVVAGGLSADALWRAPLFLLAFCGGAIGFGGSSLGSFNTVFVAASALLGAGLLALTGRAFARGRIASPMPWINVFIIGTGLMAAAARMDFGAQQALVSRYHINSCLMLASSVLMVLAAMPAEKGLGRFLRRHMGWFAALGCLYWLASLAVLFLISRYQAVV